MPGPPDSEIVAVHYSRSFGPSGSHAALVQRDGDSSLLLSFNHDGTPEVGLWQ